MPRVDELIDKVGGSCYISTLDLTRGYWQIPVAQEDGVKTTQIPVAQKDRVKTAQIPVAQKDGVKTAQIPVAQKDRVKTAFSTPYGHFQFHVMPFGLQGAPVTFQ